MSKFQDQVAKPRTSKGHKTLLDGGRKDLIKHGSPFNQARSVDSSNAFIAKEEYSEDPDQELEEVSAMAAGAVAGHVGTKPKKKKEKIKMESRDEIVEELRLKKIISSMLENEKNKFIKESLKKINQQLRLRNVLSKLISESDVEKSPHQSTAVNVLDQVFGNIKKSIEDGYMMLTTEKGQRDSYRRHLLSAVDDALRAEETNINAASEKDQQVDPPEELEEVEINIQSDNPLDVPDEDKVLPNVGDKGGDTEEPAEEKSEEEEFGIEGEERTGRDRAFPVFKQIVEPIITGYKSLHNPNDREVYHDYLLTNMKMLMDQSEESLSGVVSEPESDSYEAGDSESGEEDLSI